MKFRLGELFSGPGGLALGAELAKFEHQSESYEVQHVWANDIDPDSCDTYNYNIGRGNQIAIVGDVNNLDIKNLPSIDAFAYGFPCNDFSIVGEQNGLNGNYGGLYTYGIDVINHHNPKWFLAENVSGLQSSDEGDAFNIILEALANAGKGYNLTTHLYKFEEYGVPQTRHRIIIVGIRQDLKLKFKVPAPTTPNPDDYITVEDALADIPEKAFNHTFTTHQKTVVERLKHIPEGENAWYEGIPEHLKLNVKGAKLSQIYKRLTRNKPAYTITGSGGGGTHVYHWIENRALTNRERARIQTFPDNYEFKGKKESIRKQIGMAVPPKGAQAIIEAIFKTFAKIEYASVPAKYDSVPIQQSLPLQYIE